jgi:hypothetical protein
LIASLALSTEELQIATISYLSLSFKNGKWAPFAQPELERPMKPTRIGAIVELLGLASVEIERKIGGK